MKRVLENSIDVVEDPIFMWRVVCAVVGHWYNYSLVKVGLYDGLLKEHSDDNIHTYIYIYICTCLV